MKKKYVLRYRFDDGDIDFPISYRKRSISNAYWVDQSGEGNHVFIENPETEKGDKRWNEIMDAIDAHDDQEELEREAATDNREKGLRQHNETAKKETAERNVEVQAHIKDLESKGESPTNIMLEVCDIFKISKSTYHRIPKK